MINTAEAPITEMQRCGDFVRLANLALAPLGIVISGEIKGDKIVLGADRQVDTQQAVELARVDDKIGDLVLRFCRNRLGTKPDFHMEELTDYVSTVYQIAPDSAGRILRNLRQKREINYMVVCRRSSHYRLIETDAQ